MTYYYFEIAVIPKTWEVTNFSRLKQGDEVNLEVDVIAKYVERILNTPELKSESPPPLMIRNHPRMPAVFFLGIILALIGVNWFLFGLFHGKYFLLYLKN